MKLLDQRVARNLFWSITCIFLLTIFHHVYGGLVYEESWKILTILFYGTPVFLLTIGLQFLSLRSSARLILYIFCALTFLFWGVGLGLFEGGYNHIFKNILYFLGVDQNTMNNMFPPEMGDKELYRMPDNWMFEISGMLQCIGAFFIFKYLLQFYRNHASNKVKLK